MLKFIQEQKQTLKFFTNFSDFIKALMIPQIKGLTEPTTEKLIEFYDLMTNLRADTLEHENEVYIRALLPYFAKIASIRGGLSYNQIISK